MSAAYYNEIDPYAAQWLRNLIAAGHIAPGDVDTRSITDVSPDDLEPYTQCHFFAGIGGWSLALRLAGWPDDRPCWTGSAPCQPFSAAGKRRAGDDDRHLFPDWLRLVRACRPPIIFGEQVASRDALVWLDGEAAYMPDMRDRAAVLGVLRQLQGAPQALVQGMRYGSGAGAQEIRSGEGSRAIHGLAAGEAWACLGQRSEAPGEEARVAIRSGPCGDSGGDRRGPLRSDGDRVRSDGTEGVECPVARSDHAWRRLHEGECSCGPLCPERDGEHLGAPEDYRDCVGDFGSPEGAERALVELDCREAERSDDDARFAAVRPLLEECGYTVGALDLPACGVGAPHRRQRLYWVAHAERGTAERWGHDLAGTPRSDEGQAQKRQRLRIELGAGGHAGTLADADGAGSFLGQCDGEPHEPGERAPRGHDADGRGAVCGRVAAHDGRHPGAEGLQRSGEHRLEPAHGGAGELGDAGDARLEGHRPDQGPGRRHAAAGSVAAAGIPDAWADIEWLPCSDGKARPTQPGLFPLATGLSPGRLAVGSTVGQADAALLTAEESAHLYNRVGVLRGAGNAIVPQVAAVFIQATMP